jgi:hypothetical protein
MPRSVIRMSRQMDKRSRLLALARLRQVTRWDGYNCIADYHGGAYECDFVSPYSKTAGNIDADVMILLQDWAAHDAMNGPLHELKRDLGYSPERSTNINLTRLLADHLGLSLEDVYGTNVFPFVKPGKMASPLRMRDLVRAAQDFALPQIEIIEPVLVVCLGKATFNAVRRAAGLPPSMTLDEAIKSPFHLFSADIWCQAHTGRIGQNNRNKGGVDRVTDDWATMASAYNSRLQPTVYGGG